MPRHEGRGPGRSGHTDTPGAFHVFSHHYSRRVVDHQSLAANSLKAGRLFACHQGALAQCGQPAYGGQSASAAHFRF
jgi:hypothetical protein